MKHPAPTDLELGAPYLAACDAWEPGAELAVLERGAVLRLFVPDPGDDVFEAVVVGRVELRLARNGPLLVLLFRFGDAPWDWVPYAWPIADSAERPAPRAVLGAPPPEPLLIVLVDSDTGIVEGLRLLEPDVVFTTALRQAVLAQAAGASSPDDHNRALHALTLHPDPLPALLEASVAWWIGAAESR